MLKTCSKCKCEKDVSMFDRSPQTKDRLSFRCKSCRAEDRKLNKKNTSLYNKKYASEHSEEISKRRKANYEKNKTKEAEHAKMYRDKNKERIAEYMKKYTAHNKEKFNSKNARRKSIKLKATPAWSNDDHILGMYELASVFKRIGLDLHVDHIVPLQGDTVCGLHVENNLQLLYSKDNIRKRNYHWPDMW